MKLASKPYTIFFLIVFLVASCGPVTPMSPATATNTIPTRISIPTNTKLPEPSSTATLSQVDEMLALPTMPVDLVNTPTPIAAPAIKSSSMRLRDLSEADYLNLIYEMNKYSYENFPPIDDWWSEGNFVAAQEAVAVTIQEYLYRFPESPNADRLHWQLAFINSILWEGLAGNQYGDKWMIEELEKKLNQGEASPDHLKNILGKEWLTYVKPMKNLFGDGKIGWLYQIAPRVWDEGQNTRSESPHLGSMFFAVRERRENEFGIYLLKSAWNLSFGESSVFDVIDHNKNGQPEIALYIGGHGGTMCLGNLLIYEWNGNAFDELTKGALEANDCSEWFEYFESDGIPAIIFSQIMPARKELYVWNGVAYEFAHFLDATPLQIWWYSYYGSHLSYHEEAELLKQILESNAVPGDYPTIVDNLRYRLGVVEALDGQSRAAIRDLQGLISAPSDSTRTIFPRLAKTFLEKYQGQMTLYNACHQSELLYAQAFDAVSDLGGAAADENYLEIFGFPFDPLSMGYVRCNEEDAFRLTVSTIPTTIENVPAELRKLGVDINYFQKLDANLDRKTEEWLVIFDLYYDKFLIVPNGSQYQAKTLNSSIGGGSTNYSSTQVSLEAWKNLPSPVMLIYAGQELSLMDTDENNELFWDFEVKDYKISNQSDIPQF